MDANLNSLKKHIFFEFLNLVGRAFILVRYSDNVVLGSRGFTPEEKENGIVLVFNSRMNFSWDDYGITATLVFGTSPQKCFIPADEVIAVYSPELNAQFVTSPQPASVEHPASGVEQKWESPENRRFSGVSVKSSVNRTTHDARPSTHNKNVIKVDFTKKRK